LFYHQADDRVIAKERCGEHPGEPRPNSKAPASTRNENRNMTTLLKRQSTRRTLILFLAVFAFPRLLAAYPELTIPYPGSNLIDGTIYHTVDPPVSYVPPVTLLAWGGTPFSGYTWYLSTGWTYPPGTTVDQETGIFHQNGMLIAGFYNFDMTVSDGSTTAHATFSFNVTDDHMNPPAVTPFEQLNLSTFALPDARAGLGYGASLYADGGTPPYHNWHLVWGALPPGMVLDQTSGVVQGTPFTSAAGPYSFQIDVLDATNTSAHNPYNLTYTFNVLSTQHLPFFTGEGSLGNGVYYLQFSNGTPFGYYSYLTDPHWIYHFDMGYEYWFDANDGHNGIYFYDSMSTHFFYTSPSFPFPYLYDFSLNTVLYYYPDTNNPGHYTTNPRYFYNFATGQIITM
jgi:hypothetical protein